MAPSAWDSETDQLTDEEQTTEHSGVPSESSRSRNQPSTNDHSQNQSGSQSPDAVPSVTEEYQWAALLAAGDIVAVTDYVRLGSESAVEVSTGGPRWALTLPRFEQPLTHSHYVHAQLATSNRLELTTIDLDARSATVLPEDLSIDPYTVDIVPPTEYAAADTPSLDRTQREDDVAVMDMATPFRVTDLSRADAETVVLTARRGEHEARFSLTHDLRPSEDDSELTALVETVAAGDIEQLTDQSPVAITAAEGTAVPGDNTVVVSEDGDWLLALDRDPYEEPIWPTQRQPAVDDRSDDTEKATQTTGDGRISTEDKTVITTLVTAALFVDLLVFGVPLLVFWIAAVLVYILPFYVLLGWNGQQY